MILTLGYEGRTAGELVALARDEGVTTLVDVRYNPLSRKPGLSKTRLAAALAEAGVGYLHLRALGTPATDRDAFRAGDPEAFARVRARLRSPEGRAALAEVAALAGEGIVALLCVEREPERCHRRFVAEELLALRPGLVTEHR